MMFILPYKTAAVNRRTRKSDWFMWHGVDGLPQPFYD